MAGLTNYIGVVSQISTRSLIRLSQRVGTALRSGVDARRVWEMETRHAKGALRERLDAIRQRVAAGEPVADAMRASGGYFPPMFVQMVEVGEATGKLDEVLLRLAEHYEHGQQMQRAFWFGIAWPLFELAFGVLIIGFVIYVTRAIAASRGVEAIDVLGWGLVGTRGALIWFLGCGVVIGTIVGLSIALVRGWFGPRPLLFAMRIPVIGKCLESLALARLTWSLALSLDSGMDARRAVDLSIRAAQNPYYESSLAIVTGAIRQNKEFHESFREAGVFPVDFIQSLEAAEVAGATTESLLRLAKEYEDRARTSMRVLTAIATVGLTLLILGVIAFAVFSMAYQILVKPLYDQLDRMNRGEI